MSKLNIENSKDVITGADVFIYKFILDDGTIKSIKFLKETHNAIEAYFKPKKEKKKPAPAPNIEDVRAYFKEKGYSLQSANKFFEYYDTMGWRGANNAPVLNWKGKALAVWFVDKNKIQEKVEQTSGFFRS